MEEVTQSEIFYYNQNLISLYKNKNNEIVKKITQLVKNNTNSKEIISKYWLNIYTMSSDFYLNLNNYLRNQDENRYFYYPLIKICYEGIKKNFYF